MDVVDAVREPLDDRDVVSGAVGDVPGVQAQVHVPRVGVGEEPFDPVLGVDVGVGVRVEHQLHGAPGVHVGVLLRQVDHVPAADGGEQPCFPAEVLDGLLQRLLAAVQSGEHRAAADLQAALIKFVAQPLGVLWQEALRAELGPHEAGPGQLIEVLSPGHLTGIFRKPDAPRVGCDAQRQPRPCLGCRHRVPPGVSIGVAAGSGPVAKCRRAGRPWTDSPAGELDGYGQGQLP
jgi:hypothetical protein